MMKALLFFVLLLTVFAKFRKTDDNLQTPGYVDLDALVKIGLYYNIASKPDLIDDQCHCSQVIYSWITEGTDLGLSESCHMFSANGPNITSNSEGVPIDSTNAKLINYNFHRIAKAPYDFVQVADDYSWLAIGQPSREHFWLLNSQPTMNQTLVDSILANQTNVNGFNFSNIAYMDQSCNKHTI